MSESSIDSTISDGESEDEGGEGTGEEEEAVGDFEVVEEGGGSKLVDERGTLLFVKVVLRISVLFSHSFSALV